MRFTRKPAYFKMLTVSAKGMAHWLGAVMTPPLRQHSVMIRIVVESQ